MNNELHQIKWLSLNNYFDKYDIFNQLESFKSFSFVFYKFFAAIYFIIQSPLKCLHIAKLQQTQQKRFEALVMDIKRNDQNIYIQNLLHLGLKTLVEICDYQKKEELNCVVNLPSERLKMRNFPTGSREMKPIVEQD